ncbi:MAG: NAD(P)-dependent oxidoreductase [Candidatus Brocadia sp.]|nr:NAD(P)-dependent oxidoreductase [Candidatus Brocadia sp.]
MRILITGVLSGIGKYIYENLGGTGITRSTSAEEFEKIKRDGVDVIIHCAFNSQKDITSDLLYQYFKDNVFLTNELVSIPHKKFIFFSTVDLYPKNSDTHAEDELIRIDTIKGIYATTKLISESIVGKKGRNFLILRPTTLLGKYARKNTLTTIIEGGKEPLFLSGNSRFNYVLHSDILDFITFSIHNDIKGIFNVASTGNILLSEVANLLNKKVRFGTYLYDVGNISNDRITAFFPAFKKTPKEILNQFIEVWESA